MARSEVIKISKALQGIFDQMPGAWGCKDENSIFMYANEEYKRIIGLKNKEDIIGRSDFDMPCETVNCANIFRQQDKKVIQNLQKIKILDIHPFAGGEWKAYIFTKTPLFDEKQRCIGTIFHGVNITNDTAFEIGGLLSKIKIEGVTNELLGQHSYMIIDKCNDFTLSSRQSEVLFYLLRGKTIKQIGRLLHLSPRTIEEHLENLRIKFDVSNKYELIDRAINYGFLNIIPEGLLNTQLSIQLKY